MRLVVECFGYFYVVLLIPWFTGMKILIIGAGWFGVCIALELERLGLDFDIVDKSNGFFSGSSAKNQNRLHTSHHYSRSFETREECRRGFAAFVSRFPELSEEVRSYYIVASKGIMDFRSYVAVFEHEHTPHERRTLHDLRQDGMDLDPYFVNGDHVLLTKERWINFSKARQHFQSKLSNRLLHFDPAQLTISRDGETVSYGSKVYDLVFDATYGQLLQSPGREYEVCLTLVYRKLNATPGDPPVCVTCVEGEFFSLFVYDPQAHLFTLTHVKLTPIFASRCIKTVRQFIDDVSVRDIDKRRELMEEEVCKGLRNFREQFAYDSHYISTKTKYTDSGFADRSTRVEKHGIIVSACGGKITGALGLQAVVKQSVQEATTKRSGSVPDGAVS